MNILIDHYFGDIIEKKLLNDFDINDSTINNIFNKERFLLTFDYYELNREYELREKLLNNEYNNKLNIDNIYFNEKYKKNIYNDYLNKFDKLKIDYFQSRKKYLENSQINIKNE